MTYGYNVDIVQPLDLPISARLKWIPGSMEEDELKMILVFHLQRSKC